jgi:hypothetical protein
MAAAGDNRVMTVHAISPSALVSPQRGGRKVRAKDLATAKAAIAKLPAADRALLAKYGLHVELVGASSLEQGMLGATSVVRDSSDRWVPIQIRVASKLHGRGADSLFEVVQHEIGHAISVLREQDRSEDAAEAYARRW